jgi:hypothetical protein
MTQPAETIEQVIDRLTQIIEDSKTRQSRLGYFAALYRKVTRKVKEETDKGGYFQNDERMKRLDVTFANRYLQAYDQFQAGQQPTASWQYAFEVADEWWPIVLQHLLPGMNAHINLDLGIAAVETVGEDGLADLHGDFNKINELLAGLVGDVKRELAWVWPPLRWLNQHLGTVESAIINFSMSAARDAAWSFAEELGPLDDAGRAAAVDRRDREVALLGHAVRYPGVTLGAVTKLIRLGERGTVAEIIAELE